MGWSGLKPKKSLFYLFGALSKNNQKEKGRTTMRVSSSKIKSELKVNLYSEQNPRLGHF